MVWKCDKNTPELIFDPENEGGKVTWTCGRTTKKQAVDRVIDTD